MGNCNNSSTLIRQEPETKNLLLYRGDSFSLRVFVWNPAGVPLDVSTATWKAEIRTAVTSPTIVTTFDTVPVVGDVSAVDLNLTPAKTKLFPATLFWDLEMTLNSWVTSLFVGQITTRPDVSRVDP